VAKEFRLPHERVHTLKERALHPLRRSGVDVLRALALGARAVLIGRPLLWGLAVGGEAGARRVLELIRGELEVALALAGVPRAASLDRDSVQAAPWAGGA
jgi:4-hydroxymandelate oxidase